MSLAVVALDQFTKSIAVKFLSGVGTSYLLPGVLHLTLVRNPGVAFGLFSDFGLPVAVVTTMIIVGILTSALWRPRAHPVSLTVSLGLILGGATGNLVDRIRVGGVIDFIDFRVWPVFNVADACITVGALWMAWDLLRRR